MKKIPFLLILLVVISSCNPKKTWERKSVERKEAGLMEEAKKGKVDTAGIKDLMNTYESYAKSYPSDTLGADFLFKEADFYRYMHKPLNTLAIYRQIYNDYPTFEKRPFALFLQGFTFEEDMGNLDSAKAKYELFLALYPDHPIAHDVKITLDNLGKSAEQLIEGFEEHQHADSLVQAK
jgi:tetratricopeptide (TPR) repeat protein